MFILSFKNSPLLFSVWEIREIIIKNPDTVKADGIKNVVDSSKNLSTDKPRQVADGNVFVDGLKVKAISGLDSSKLKIKQRKFN